MNYCLSVRQPASILRQADEIKVTHRDYRIIVDLLKDYPEKIIIWELPVDYSEFKNLIISYAQISDNFICCLSNLATIDWFKQNNIKFYYGYPVNNFSDLRALDNLGVEYIYVTGSPLFDISSLKDCKAKLRAVPNVAYDAYVPRSNGLAEGWIRPEDALLYENIINTFEFEGNLNLEQERAMWGIYQKGKWPGNLDVLITNLNQNVVGAGLPDEFGETRACCRQKCMRLPNSCHYCQTAVALTNQLEKKIAEDKKNG